MVITGGSDESRKGVKTVAQYKLGTRFGVVQYLMELKTGRLTHACSKFVNEGGVTVN